MELKLSQEFLTENDCYQAGRKIVPKGIMVHSTGRGAAGPAGVHPPLEQARGGGVRPRLRGPG